MQAKKRPYTPKSAFIESVVEGGKTAMSHPKTNGYDVTTIVQKAERQSGLISTINMGKPLNRLNLAQMNEDTQRLYLQNLIDTYNPPLRALGVMLGYKETGAYSGANQMLKRLGVKKKDARAQSQRQLHMWKAFLNGSIAEEKGPQEPKQEPVEEPKPQLKAVFSEMDLSLFGTAEECTASIANVLKAFGEFQLNVCVSVSLDDTKKDACSWQAPCAEGA